MAGETPITVVGNLTADPELRFTPSGAAVANFTVASTPRTFDRQSNEWKDGETLFLRCSVWREAAENMGATPAQYWRHVAFPVLLLGLGHSTTLRPHAVHALREAVVVDVGRQVEPSLHHLARRELHRVVPERVRLDGAAHVAGQRERLSATPRTAADEPVGSRDAAQQVHDRAPRRVDAHPVQHQVGVGMDRSRDQPERGPEGKTGARGDARLLLGDLVGLLQILLELAVEVGKIPRQSHRIFR